MKLSELTAEQGLEAIANSLEHIGNIADDDLSLIHIFRDRLKFQHIAKAEEGQVQAYTQEPPYTARKEFLTQMRSEIYEDFGALDVHTIAAGATNDHIDAAYQPLEMCIRDSH